MESTSANAASAEPAGSPGRRGGTRLAVLVGIASSVLFVWLAVRGVEWDKAEAAIGGIRWSWIVVYLAVATTIQGLRMTRWSCLLHAMGERRLGRTMAVGAAGLSAIFFLPARLGEAVRPAVIADRGPVRLAEAIATVVVERLVDGMIVGLMLVALGFWVDGDMPHAATIRNTGWIVGGIFVALTAAVTIAAALAERSRGLIDRILGSRPQVAARLHSMLCRFRDGLVAIARSGQTVPYLAQTILLWVLSGLSIVPLFMAFDLGLPVSAAFVVLSAQAVGILVPAAPTSVGPFHFATIWALGLYAVPEAAAFNLAVVNHVAQILVNLAVGVGGIVAGGLSPSELRRRVNAADLAGSGECGPGGIRS